MTTSTPLDRLAEPYELDAAQLARYVADGFVKLPQVLDRAIIERFEPEITAKVIELNTMHLPLSERDTYSRAFLQVENLWRHSDLVRQLVFSPRLARIAAALMGVRGVRLYHDQALYKEAGGGHTPWHRDQHYWPVSTANTLTVWIPLQDTPAPMGPLTFAAGSQTSMAGRDLLISDASDRALAEFVAAQGYRVENGPFEIGDVSFHAGWTVHRAGPNTTETPRRVMTMIYIDADIEITEPINDWQAADWRNFLGGAPVGGPATGPLNPVLHPA